MSWLGGSVREARLQATVQVVKTNGSSTHLASPNAFPDALNVALRLVEVKIRFEKKVLRRRYTYDSPTLPPARA